MNVDTPKNLESKLSNKVAIITGASKGIGAEIAIRLAENNYNIILNYRSDENGANKVEKSCNQHGVRTIQIKGDITNPETIDNIIDAAKSNFGKIDCLINNAAITKFVRLNDFESLTQQDFQDIFEVNVFSAYQLSCKARKLMSGDEDSCIVNISSTSAFSGVGSSVAYASSKGALNTLTISLAKLFAPEIRVNAASVGFTDTQWWLNHFEPERYEKFKNKQREKSILKRITTPSDVANAVLYLCTSPAVTGEIVQVDSGISLGSI
jgi:3-oxoacyl-[acyl-carrier protein] reductase